MNKFSIIKTSVVMILSISGMAYANSDDLHHSLFNTWTGFYAGVDAKAVFNNAQLKSQQLGFTNPSETCDMSSNFSTFSPGAHVGYLYQSSNAFVYGLEASIAYNMDQQDSLKCTCPFTAYVSDRFTFRNQMQSALKGRVGQSISWNNNTFLPYLTAGVSMTNLGLKYSNEGGDYYSKENTKASWLIGAGLEWAFMQNWSVRAEYYYVNYGNAIKLKIPSIYGLIDQNGKARIALSSTNFALAINYWI